MPAFETIYALSTAPGRAGVAVVRVSGPQARSALESLTGGQRHFAPRVATRAQLIQPNSRQLLDDGLAIWFPGPKSFTGEDVVELHVHGGRAVVAGVMAALGQHSGLRSAEPGEFTRRAFENGKLDLTEAEGLADLIDAETESQRLLALNHMAGVLRRAADQWRDNIILAQALAEAAIDFSDEGDVSAKAFEQARERARDLAAEIRRNLDDQNKGEILRDGFRVVVAGPPNAGKSSLINRLAGRDAVIVSDEAGTTRDVVELHLNLDGVRVIVADTAGIRDAEGKVEREGIRRGLASVKAAHLVLWVTDRTAPVADLPAEMSGLNIPLLRVKNKSDLTRTDTAPVADAEDFVISTISGDGVERLVREMAHLARQRTQGGTASLITQDRHRAGLEAAERGLIDFLATPESHAELAAEHLRSAANALGKLTGRIDVEDVLGAIFGRFCIGK